MATHPMQPEPQEETCFTSQPSDTPWVLSPADAEAVIDSWEDHRQPSESLKAAYAQYLKTVRQA
jgi:hypothetical protein